MTNDLSAQAGNILSGKEEDRLPDDVVARKRKAKLMKPGISDEATMDAAPAENATADDDVYLDTLLKFGIRI